jgi:hypothetical protein
MTLTPDHEALEKAYEAAAKALKRALRDELSGGPLLGDERSGDFHAQGQHPALWASSGSSIDLEKLSRAAISTFLSSLDGYKLLNNVVTSEMDAAGCGANACVSDIWEAMLDAAPDITKKGTE